MDVLLRGGSGAGLYIGNQEGYFGEDEILLIGHRYGGRVVVNIFLALIGMEARREIVRT